LAENQVDNKKILEIAVSSILLYVLLTKTFEDFDKDIYYILFN